MMKFVLLLLWVAAATSLDDKCDVTAPTGRIRGSIISESRKLRKKICAFRGVRYAEPPTRQRRFQIAIPAVDWNNTFDATKEGPSCPGRYAKNISEDCLRLNVYTTKLPSASDPVRRSVLVFFHPGGFYLFSAQSFVFGPEYLMDKDIVLVTVNYRLASLGFLSTGDSKAPGNLGLKDQVEALKWIKRNIGAFGGDPNSVTISGYSAGGVSVFLHMVSPMSEGLFHRAIMMSGSTTKEPLPTHQQHLTKKQAELLGCPTDTTGSMMICLNSKPAENFTNTISNFFELYNNSWAANPILMWSPVVEPEICGVERFLPEQPYDLIRKGQFHKVPLIAGITKDEFASIIPEIEKQRKNGDTTLLDDFNNKWHELAPLLFGYEDNTPRSRNISTKLKEFYFGNQEIGPNTYDALAHIKADSINLFPMYRSVKLLAQNSDRPVYFYKFTYQGRYSFGMWNETTPYGVVHHDDLQYLFFMKFIFPYFEQNAPEIPMVELMTSTWSNFVQTGQPTLANNITWEPYDSTRDNYLDISEEPEMKTKFYPDRMREWESLFPLPPL